MNRKTSLSLFLPLILEEYEENRQPKSDDSPRDGRKKSEYLQSLSRPYIGSISASSDQLIFGSDELYHRQTTSGIVSVVSDNAKIPTTRLREQSGSLQTSDDSSDDKRESSLTEFEDDDSKNRDMAEVDNEEPLLPQFPDDSRRRNDVPWMSNDSAENKIDELQDHRWSAHCSFSSIQGLPGAMARVDHMPKKGTRRPSV